MRKVINCLEEEGMVGATITAVASDSRKFAINTDKGIILISSVSEHDPYEDWTNEFVFLHHKANIGDYEHDSFYLENIDVDEALALNLIDEKWVEAYREDMMRKKKKAEEMRKEQRIIQLKKELEELESEDSKKQ